MSELPPIRVLIVDDSAFMRRALGRMLERDAEIEIVAMAESGEEALALIAARRPDVVTMDVEMKGIGGIEALRRIVERHGPPVIMVSSLTQSGAQITLAALEFGAVDFIAKPAAGAGVADLARVADDLRAKIHAFGRARPKVPARPRIRPERPLRPGRFECVAIGTSTGGPVALSRILPRIPANFPLPIVIVQHMPPGFTGPLAQRLNLVCAIDVVEGAEGMTLRGGCAIVAPAGKQIDLRRDGAYVRMRLADDARGLSHVPSVDALASAVGDIYGPAAVGVILTGMGHDGVEGLRVLKSAGGYVLGQDEASAVVYGMPRAAAQAGLVNRVVALDEVAPALCELVGLTLPSR